MVLHEAISDYKLILASQSPRRKMLMEGLNLKFKVVVRPDIEEKVPEGLDKFEIPVFLAKLKSQAYLDFLNSKTIVITADTIVWINGRELGKPRDFNDAVNILTELSGNMHEVVTGVCIKSKSQEVCFHAVSKVFFRNLTDNEINYYLKEYKPFDKAGSYGIQEWIGYAGIEKIEGSFYNVMGLPVQALYMELLKFITNEKNMNPGDGEVEKL